VKQRLFLLLALVFLLTGCPSTPPELDAGEQRIPDATLVQDGGVE
jgi:starvation-inducible outer membrane lipoprotein